MSPTSTNLFGTEDLQAPLADRMRPVDFDTFVGQPDIIGPDSPLVRLTHDENLPSIIFWGPPGTGKTTLARIIATRSGRPFVPFSAVTSGIKEIRQLIKEARARRSIDSKNMILFIDEIHRFNRAQQDAFLPHVEDGTILLFGATTENPSFHVNSALLSRCRVFHLQPLTTKDLSTLIQRALADPKKGLGKEKVHIDDNALDFIVRTANGDARMALNLLEMAVFSVSPKNRNRHVTLEHLESVAQSRSFLYDPYGEEHYNLISALHKSMRGSDPQAALYWLARMLESGEDPLYIARRMIRFASEDIGNADPRALVLTVSARQAVHTTGMPECELALAQCVVYLACAPKSNRIYTAYQKAKDDVHNHPTEPVPLHLRNAVTGLMKEEGYGKGYQYSHDIPEKEQAQTYLPDSLRGRIYYTPSEQGEEARLRQERKPPSPDADS